MGGARLGGDGVQCGSPSQDLGNREFLHAAAMARLYLMGLKHWPRLIQINNWMARNNAFMDHNLTPYMWLKMVNTLGHLLPDPRFYGDARPFANVLGAVYRQDDHAVLALWTNDNDVELGLKKGPNLTMDLPSDARFYDLMGNERRCEVERRGGGGQRNCQLPLTSAPLFVVLKDAAALLKAVETCETDDRAMAVTGDIVPTADGSVELKLENGTRRVQETTFGELGPREKKTVRLVPPQAVEPMKRYSFATNFPELVRPWRLEWFYVPKCGVSPDWTKVPAMAIDNQVKRPGNPEVTMKANVRAAWNAEKLFLRVEIEDDRAIAEKEYPPPFRKDALFIYDGCLEVYFDGFADARRQRSLGHDLNDMRYDFAFGRVNRQVAVNWQLAQGTQSATQEEIAEKLEQKVVPTAKGYAYEIALAARYLAPIDLKAGTRASLGLFIHDRDTLTDRGENGLSLATQRGSVCNKRPDLWPEFILSEE